jgi:hypothetical protein
MALVYRLRKLYPDSIFSVKQQATDWDNTRTLSNGIVFEFSPTI